MAEAIIGTAIGRELVAILGAGFGWIAGGILARHTVSGDLYLGTIWVPILITYLIF